ncbi:MAG: hypothetical protein Q7U60_03435 [Candidatus Methanoperedens sp.]|nr:hypothetical protein [Candidatus Methanoperedens sp.]
MQDKCPKCGELLITRTIKKELGLGSIDYPIARECPKCNWSKDLTGAGEIVSKPVTASPREIKKEEKPAVVAPAPQKQPKQPKPESTGDINKLITVALAILVLSGLVWAFFLYPDTTKTIDNIPQPTATPEITRTTVQPTSTPVAEVTPTGKSVRVLLENRRGFLPNTQTIKLGDEIVWRNDGKETVTLVSNEGLFNDQILADDKELRYTFKKTGTYSFNLKGKEMKGTIIVEP